MKTLLDFIRSGRARSVPFNSSFNKEVYFEEISALLAIDGSSDRSSSFLNEPKCRDFLIAVVSNSEHLHQLSLSQADALAAYFCQEVETVFQACLEETEQLHSLPDSEKVMSSARRLKSRVALLLALADLSGFWTTDQVVIALTRFADTCVSAVVRKLLNDAASSSAIEAAPDQIVAQSGYVVLAMGKHGGFELNYSSDIDLIVVFDPERNCLAEEQEAAPTFIRITQNLVRILQERTAEGYVFRVDLRLRPDPSATAIAVSRPAALHYYEARGQTWERAALIKARPIAGDLEAGRRFLDDLKPFIWRRYLDFATISETERIMSQIHGTSDVGVVRFAGRNIKLGRGGIRQIEFFAQTQQLITGGRHPELRSLRTTETLDQLAAGRWIDSRAAQDLKKAYWALREIEHRLQMRTDEKTHILPKSDDHFKLIAHLCGYVCANDFRTALSHLFELVERQSSGLFGAHGRETNAFLWICDHDSAASDQLEKLNEMGFERAPDVVAILRGWLSGRYAATHTKRARELLCELLPDLLTHLASNDNPDGAVVAFDRFLQRLPAGIQLFSLLSARPALLSLLTRIMGTAPRLADTVVGRPHVLDPLLEPAFFHSVPGQAAMEQMARDVLDVAASYEEGLDVIRILGREQQFLIGARVLSEAISPHEAGRAYSDLASSLLSALLPFVIDEFAAKHGRVADQEIVLLALGRLGSRDMTARSDLDLILIYNHDPASTTSDGPKPLAARPYFARLTQRLVAAIASPTAEGWLYEVDFRLRPSGNAGPLATHIEAFESYQQQSAWTWEHMALTRARVVCGTSPLAERTRAVIHATLGQSRPWATLRDDARKMRARLELNKATDNPWALKQVAGGLIDIDFIAQILVLRYSSEHIFLGRCGTLDILEQAATLDLIENESAQTLAAAHQLYQSLLQLERICLSEPANANTISKGYGELICRARELPNIEAVTGELRDTQFAVRQVFNDFFEVE